MKTALLLAAGKGKKFWPYATVRNKCLFPVVNKPSIQYLVEDLLEEGIDDIIIATENFTQQFVYAFKDFKPVRIIEIQDSQGNADTLVKVLDKMENLPDVVFYGDSLIQRNDIKKLLESNATSVLLSKVPDHQRHWIACGVDGEYLTPFIGHNRDNKEGYRLHAWRMHPDFVKALKVNPQIFQNLKVGVSSPLEAFVEESMNEWMKTQKISAIIAQEAVFDLDKPWHAIEANLWMADRKCQTIVTDRKDYEHRIHPSAVIKGRIELGEGSVIGSNVYVEGPVIIGRNCMIENGVSLIGPLVIGDHSSLKHHAKVNPGSVIGAFNKLDQCFEFLGGVTLSKVAMVHVGEYYGCIGENSDLGAGTFSGTLRFDDRATEHATFGHRETPINHANASYLGDYTRTGVGVNIMPGVKVGSYSIVSSGVTLIKDLEDKKIIYIKQNEQVEVIQEWSEERYGW